MRAGPKMKTEGVGGAIGGGVGLVGGGVGAVTGGVTKIGGAAIGGVTKVGGAAVGGVSKVGGAAMGGVTGTFGKLGAAAGFQSLFGEVDKSDAGLEKAFKSVDVNGNGKITNAERKISQLGNNKREELEKLTWRERKVKSEAPKQPNLFLPALVLAAVAFALGWLSSMTYKNLVAAPARNTGMKAPLMVDPEA